MKDIRITYTYHKKNFDLDEEPTTGTIVLPVEDLEMLEKYGAKVDYLEVPAGALDILRGCYRLVHLVEILDGNRCTVKCTQGSSTFTTGEMKNLIDGIFDRLAEMGVNDPMVTAYWQEWSEQ